VRFSVAMRGSEQVGPGYLPRCDEGGCITVGIMGLAAIGSDACTDCRTACCAKRIAAEQWRRRSLTTAAFICVVIVEPRGGGGGVLFLVSLAGFVDLSVVNQ